MVHILGQKKETPHIPTTKVIINKSTPVGAVVMTCKVGITSVSEGRWRAWYAAVMTRPGAEQTMTFLTAPPAGLSEERAKAQANMAAQMQMLVIRTCLDQVVEDETKAMAEENKARAAIDKPEGSV